jgi:hypothetical protein
MTGPVPEGEESEYELVLPFVICKSRGGPYDDDAFVSGWRLGQISAALEPQGTSWAGLVQEAELPQLDLMAMRRDCRLEVLSNDLDGGWVRVSLTRQGVH